MAVSPTLRPVDPLRRRGRLYGFICRLSTTAAGMWLAEKVSWKLDPFLLGRTGGRISTAWPIPTALLETRGARTGRSRRNATIYFHDGDRVTIIASYRGEPRHPAWYFNVCAHPDVVYGGQPFRAQIVADPAEQQRLWALADRVFPPFALYREWAARANRSIPIVQLVPRQSRIATA